MQEKDVLMSVIQFLYTISLLTFNAGCSTKMCKFYNASTLLQPTTLNLNEFRSAWSAEQEVFMKTLALFTALEKQGCSFKGDDQLNGNDSDSVSEGAGSDGTNESRCSGCLLQCKSSSGQSIIQ